MSEFGRLRDLVSWDKRYAVGITIVDKQHRKLFGITNELYRAIHSSTDQKGMEASFIKSVHETVEYVKEHFATEEELMRATAYPGYATHKAEHEDFARRILNDVATYEGGDTKVIIKFVHFLQSWLVEHIAVTDKALGSHAKNKGQH